MLKIKFVFNNITIINRERKRSQLDQKAFMIIYGCCKEVYNFYNLRKLSESIMSFLGCKINSFSLIYYDNASKLRDAVCVYKESNYTKYDSCNMNKLSFCSFAAHFRKGKGIGHKVSVYFHSPCDSHKNRIMIVWDNASKEHGTFCEETKSIGKIIQSKFTIDCVLADLMSVNKNVELFAQGIEVFAQESNFSYKSSYENQIARNINRCIYDDNRIPFLFSYTFVAKNFNLSFEDETPLFFGCPDLLGEEFEDYDKDPTWKENYDNWIERGLIAPLQDI